MVNLAFQTSVRIVFTLVAMMCDMSFLHMLILVAQVVMNYFLILIWKLPKIPTPFENGMARGNHAESRASWIQKTAIRNMDPQE
jgi:hypothetical protein